MITLATLLDYARHGRVFPLAYRSKKPLGDWKYGKQAHLYRTQDPSVIENWYHNPLQVNGRSFSKRPGKEHNWAWIPDLCVIDGDVKDGARGLQSIEAAGGLSHLTRLIRTPSGGLHWYFGAHPEAPHKTRNGWLPGVDIRYGNGLVIIPGSVTSKGTYAVLVDVGLDELLPMPKWIKDKLIHDATHPQLQPIRIRSSLTPRQKTEKERTPTVHKM